MVFPSGMEATLADDEVLAHGRALLEAVEPEAVDDLEAWAARGAVTSTSDPRGAVLPAKRQTLPGMAQPGRYAR